MLEEQYRKWQQELEPEPEADDEDAPISLFDFIGLPTQPLGGVAGGEAAVGVAETGEAEAKEG